MIAVVRVAIVAIALAACATSAGPPEPVLVFALCGDSPGFPMFRARFDVLDDGELYALISTDEHAALLEYRKRIEAWCACAGEILISGPVMRR